MRHLAQHISFKVHESLFIKNPESSDTGHKIVRTGLELMHELGLEQFTFRKLGDKMGSPESTIYRYFENKHNFLLYLLSIYWLWLEYCIVLETKNVESDLKKLSKSIRVLTTMDYSDIKIGTLDANLLAEVAAVESTKVFLTKLVDKENKEGIFKVYKRLVNRVAQFVNVVNPEFKHPHSLISTIIEGAHLQHFYSQHIPQLCNFSNGTNKSDFFEDMVLTFTKYYADENAVAES